jgi:hypothetical protein
MASGFRFKGVWMKTILALQIATLLSLSTTSMAATVEYQHPNLTIVAREEPLTAVLKSLGKEMRIYVTIPTGLDPAVNCDIQQQPVKQALKTLLGDMSYSLEWEENTGQLVGVTILAAGQGSAMATVNQTQMEAQRQEAQEETMKEEVAHHDAETAAYLESQGLPLEH